MENDTNKNEQISMENEVYIKMFKEGFDKYLEEGFYFDLTIGRAFATAISSALSDVIQKMVKTRPYRFEEIVRLELIVKGAVEAYKYFYAPYIPEE